LALNYAIENPARVKSLALIAAQYKMPKILLKIQNIIFQIMPQTAFNGIGFQKSDFIELTNSMAGLDFSARLKNISCDTLILCGAKDSANKKAASGLAAGITGARLKFLENSAHEANKDNPEQLASELAMFWRL